MVKISCRGATIHVSCREKNSKNVVEIATSLLKQLHFGYQIHGHHRNFEYKAYNRTDDENKKTSCLSISAMRRSGKIRMAYFYNIYEYIVACAIFKYLKLDDVLQEWSFSLPIGLTNSEVRNIASGARLTEGLERNAF